MQHLRQKKKRKWICKKDIFRPSCYNTESRLHDRDAKRKKKENYKKG